MWTPGCWAYGPDGYYWVPGVWVLPPNPGLLWTPAYWGYSGGYYHWHAGYWGEHVGFYGGVNYGFGYNGVGFGGGRWEGRVFHYNTAVVNVDRHIVHNVYEDRTVIRDREHNRASFNGPGGIAARPREREVAAVHDHHVTPTAEQASHHENAGTEHEQFAAVNHGRPATATMNQVHGTRFSPEGQVHQAPVHTEPVRMQQPAVQHSNPIQHSAPARVSAPRAPSGGGGGRKH
jgi:hypothetical protein